MNTNLLFFSLLLSLKRREMAFISHKVYVISLLVFCATADNKTNQPSYKTVSDILLSYVSNVIFWTAGKTPFLGLQILIDLTFDKIDPTMRNIVVVYDFFGTKAT